ncbi:M48 family metallopeptidase [Vibrio ruber]|uniref:M48 family metallopeptidase n=1 Tax=Vibrio ruber TaxID=184755 RepID=UPI0028935D8B|nr:M48 family metallopeptidase [Vibrio ruber]WNJ96246.1 M48 family metallopeptidase [Vibrio ruber]
MRVTGAAYPPRLSQRCTADIDISGAQVELYCDNELVSQTSFEQLTLSDSVGNLPVRISFPDGWVFVPEQNEDIDVLLQTKGKKSLRIRQIESNLWLILVSIIFCVAMLFAGYRYGIPWFSHYAARMLPERVPAFVGEKILEQLDEQFETSHIPAKQQQAIRARVDLLQQQLPPMPFPVKIEFRDSEIANAFALPGGTIVLLDPLVELAESDQQLDGVILHEMGHVYHRHMMTRLVESSLTAVVVASLTGDTSGVVHQMIGAGVFVMNTGLSRDMERQADQFAKQAMLKIYHTSEPMAAMFELLRQQRHIQHMPDWLSSHPNFSERIESMRQP